MRNRFSISIPFSTYSQGCVCFGMVFIVEKLGSVFSIGIAFSGITSGTLLGLFTMGMISEKFNTKGALVGSIVSTFVVGVIAIGAQISIFNGELKYESLPFNVGECENPLNKGNLLTWVAQKRANLKMWKIFLCLLKKKTWNLSFAGRTEHSMLRIWALITRQSIGFLGSITCTTGEWEKERTKFAMGGKCWKFLSRFSLIGAILVAVVGYPISVLTGGTKNLDQNLLSPLCRKHKDKSPIELTFVVSPEEIKKLKEKCQDEWRQQDSCYTG